MFIINSVGECSPGLSVLKDMVTKLYPEVERKNFYQAISDAVGDKVYDILKVYGDSEKDVLKLCFDCWQYLHYFPLQGTLFAIHFERVEYLSVCT